MVNRPTRPPEDPAQAPEPVPLDSDQSSTTASLPTDSETPSGLSAGQFAPPLPGATAPRDEAAMVDQSIRRLMDVLNDDGVSEVVMNTPSEVYRKTKGAHVHEPLINFGSVSAYHDAIDRALLSRTDTPERVSHSRGLVEGQMTLDAPQAGLPPTLARVHVVGPPATPWAVVTIAKKARVALTVDDITSNGAMTPDMSEFLKTAARGRATTVVSGPTGAGKTTLLQALASYFDPMDRVVVVEDTPELRLQLGNTIYLKSTPQRPGLEAKDNYTLEWFVRQANRMRMDRVIVGECRGPEFAEWLVAANSGAEGSMTTLHANDPRQALAKMLSLALKGGTQASERVIQRDIASTVDLIVQASPVDRKHVITSIVEVSSTVGEGGGVIQTNPLFEYERQTNMHRVVGQPSDTMKAWFAQRGVPVNQAWFRR